MVDLHGLRYRDATDTIVRCCSEYETPFTVITGNSTQMKKIVAAAAAEMGLKVRDSYENPGRVIIYDK